MNQSKPSYSICLDDLEAVKLGLKMIHQHHPKGLISGRLQNENESLKVEIDTEGYIKMSTYFERNVIASNKLSFILHGILTPFLELGKYYLDSDYILISAEAVYMHPQTNAVAFVYGSQSKNAQESSSIEDRLKVFIRGIIYEDVRLEQPNCKLVAEVLSYLKEPGWHIKGLLYLLDQTVEDKHLVIDVEAKAEVEKIDMQINESLDESRFGLKESSTEKNKQSRKNSRSTTQRRITLPAAIVTLAVLIAIIRSMSLSSTEKMGLTIIVTAAIVYLTSRIMTRKAIKEEKHAHDIPSVMPQIKSDLKNQEDLKKERFVLKKESHQTGNEDRTVVKRPVQEQFILLSTSGNNILLNKDIMTIGRQETVAEIFIADNPSVGRQHAQLIRLESGFAVKDLKSVNGTFVNDEKVLPEQAIALQHDDVLRISDEVFRFKAMY